MSNTLKFIGIFVTLVVAIALARWIVNPWFAPQIIWSNCSNQRTPFVAERVKSEENLSKCFEDKAKLFMEKDYAESKDLAKTFLTLLSALLVTSITFSKKIVDIHNAKRTPLVAMISCWMLLLLSIIFTDAGLGSMAVAAGIAVYSPARDYFTLANHAIYLFILGCFSFGFALLALITAGTISMLDRRSTNIKAEAVDGAV